MRVNVLVSQTSGTVDKKISGLSTVETSGPMQPWCVRACQPCCMLARGPGVVRLASQPDSCALARARSAGPRTGLPTSISATDP